MFVIGYRPSPGPLDLPSPVPARSILEFAWGSPIQQAIHLPSGERAGSVVELESQVSRIRFGCSGRDGADGCERHERRSRHKRDGLMSGTLRLGPLALGEPSV